MREHLQRLEINEQMDLAQISVNYAYKKLLQMSINEARLQMANLDPDDKRFEGKYRGLQSYVGHLEGCQKLNQVLFDQFYKEQQLAADKEKTNVEI